MQKIKERTKSILELSEKACNSDRELILEYVKRFYPSLDMVEIETFLICVPMTSILRSRRKIQHEGMYLSNKQIKAYRDAESLTMKAWAVK